MQINMKEYADNREAKGIKIFYHLRSGLSVLNEFKNLIMFVFGIYLTLHLNHWWWLVIMFAVALPILVIVGRLFVTRWNKILEYFSIKDGTHFSIRNFQLVEEQAKTLKNIESLLKQIYENNKDIKK